MTRLSVKNAERRQRAGPGYMKPYLSYESLAPLRSLKGSTHFCWVNSLMEEAVILYLDYSVKW